MRFSCESCGAQYMISDEKVGPSGVKVRCKKCGSVIPLRRAPASGPEVAALTSAERRAENGAADAELDRELGHAFQNVFGGGSVGVAAERSVATEPAPPWAGVTAGGPQPGSAATESDGGVEGHEWYVAIDDRQVGPLGAHGVKARWESGEVGPDTLAWRAGFDDWTPLASIPEMSRYLSPAAVREAAATTSAPAAALNGAAAVNGAAALDGTAILNGAAALNGAAHHAVKGAANGAVNGAANGAANGHDVSWQPSAASALAALASEEMSTREQAPPPSSGPTAREVKSGSLVDTMKLPEGGVDPTNLVPLPMNGLEPTSEVVLKHASSAPETTEIRQIKKSARRSGAAAGVIVATAVAAAVAVGFWFVRPGSSAQHATAEAPRDAPPAPVAVASPPSVPPDPQPAAAPVAPEPAAGSSAAAPRPAPPAAETAPPPAVASQPAAPEAPRTKGEAPAPSQAQPAIASSSVRPAPERAAPPPRGERSPAEKAMPGHRNEQVSRPARQRVATSSRLPEPPPQRREQAAPTTPAPAVASAAPAAEPARRKPAGDPLLDVGGDDELEKELSGKPRRNVYVPPAIGSDLPDSVSVSQINEAVVGQKAALLRCIEQQKSSDPEARGTLKLRWIISADGSTRDLRVLSDEFARQPIAGCISGVVRSIRFPRSRTNGQEVVFPFKF